MSRLGIDAARLVGAHGPDDGTAGAATNRRTWREPVDSHVDAGQWRHRVACRSVDPEVFFPSTVSGRRYEARVRVAKAVCAGCPVRPECLSWALSALPDGIAGGMTEEERRTARPRVGRRGAGTSEGESASVATVALSRVSHSNGLAGRTSSGRTPRVDDDPGA